MLGNDLLRGELVYLGVVVRADLPLFGKWFADLDVLRLLWTNAIFPQTEEDETEWFERMRKSDDVTFAIRTLDDDTLLGTATLKSPDWRNRASELGIFIGSPENWGKGYGTDAARVTLRYGFYELNLNRIELSVSSFNARAIKSYQKIGFRDEGARRQALYRDGDYHDIHVMGILREEWLSDGQ